MKISKTQISKRKKKKTNPEIVETIELAKKNNLLDLAKKLSSSQKFYKKINLDELNKIKDEKIIVVGKILGSGEIDRKFSVNALGFSSSAKKKLVKVGCNFGTIKQELEKNKKLEGVKII